jgi:hypothetical protein
MDKLASEGLLSLIMEKKGILGPTSGRRPGRDHPALVSRQRIGNRRCSDESLQSEGREVVEPLRGLRAQQKQRGKNYLFAAVVFETTGAINEEGARVLSQLARFAAKRQGREFSSFCGRAWVRFSCNLQRSVSQAILNRLEGSPVEVAASPERFVLELPSSVSVSLVPQVSRQSPPEIPVCPLSLPLSHHTPQAPRPVSPVCLVSTRSHTPVSTHSSPHTHAPHTITTQASREGRTLAVFCLFVVIIFFDFFSI